MHEITSSQQQAKATHLSLSLSLFSTNDGLVSNVNTSSEFSTSDHKIVSFNINLKVYKDNGSKELIFMYCKGNFEKLRKLLADTDWSIAENKTDVNKL